MKLSQGFPFSQTRLQDFDDCPRRFYLRYIQQIAWPAIESEPYIENELYMQQGALFHRLVNQHLLGIPEERLSRLVNDAPLSSWWANYLVFFQTLNLESDPPARYYAERSLSAPVVISQHPGGQDAPMVLPYRWVAKYDLLIFTPDGKALIYDWKTSRRRPKRAWLEKRWQTVLYPYLLMKAGATLNGGKTLAPQDITMIYWYASHPRESFHFPYDEEQYRATESLLTDMVTTIEQLDAEQFEMTNDGSKCKYCSYRSLCDRGVQAGTAPDSSQEEQDSWDLLPDIDQIAEVEY